MVAGWTATANPARANRARKPAACGDHAGDGFAAIEPNLRIEHAVDWALRKRWIGIDSEGRAMLAAAVLANGGRTAAAHRA